MAKINFCFLPTQLVPEDGGGECVHRNKGRGVTENNNCLNGKREGERGEKRAVELFLSIPEIIDLLLSPNLGPLPLPAPLPREELVTAQLCEREKYIYIYKRICPSELVCGAGQNLIVRFICPEENGPTVFAWQGLCVWLTVVR